MFFRFLLQVAMEKVHINMCLYIDVLKRGSKEKRINKKDQ